MVGEFPVHQGRYVEVALVGQVERELQTGDDVALGRSEVVVLGVGVHADFERHVMQRPDAEGLGAEDFVEAEGAAEQAVDFGCAGAVAGGEVDVEAGIDARRSGIVMTRLEHRDGEEVGAVLPCIEVGERIDLLRGLAVDGAVRADREDAGVGAGEDVGIGDPVVDHEEERYIGDRLDGLDRQVGGAGEAGWRQSGE